MDKTLDQAASNELLFNYTNLNEETFKKLPGKEAFIYDRNAMLNMFRKGVEWEKRQSPWISVEERLPLSDDDLYIALDTKMNPSGCDVCEFNPNTKQWTDSKGYIVFPTHWMPIPLCTI